MSRSITRALLVQGIGVGALLSTSSSKAEAISRRDICNTQFSASCEDKSDEDIRFICDNFCPAWTSATCHDGGNLSCDTRVE